MPRRPLELDELKDIAAWWRDGGAYSKQYFTVGRQAHVRATQSLGTPSLVWHVGFWPTRDLDPQNLNGSGQQFTREEARKRYVELRQKLAADLDEKVLRKLQERGRAGRKVEVFGRLGRPSDWEPSIRAASEPGPPEEPVGVFPVESITFTIWWSDDEARATCPNSPDPSDLRVRVQADIHPDFATLTFIVDAGKPWNASARTVNDGRGPVGGRRRARIFEAARTVMEHAAARLKKDPVGKDDLVPEAGVTADEAKALLDASNLLYSGIWDELCRSFDCHLTDFAGATDKVFANFRGVVLAAEPRFPKGSDSPLSRFAFDSTSSRGNLDDPYPNAVVKAHWPFVRRTRSEADYRDWIACGVFDWRALYVTALGGQSELDPGDEAEIRQVPAGHAEDVARLRAETKWSVDVPEGFLPKRAVLPQSVTDLQRRLDELRAQHGGDRETLQLIDRLKADLDPSREVPTSQCDPPNPYPCDLPRPFHYLFLTSGEPNRRQAGRMVDRVNLLGTIRLYAMKNYSIIRDADVHLRIYGQLLDLVMTKATTDAQDRREKWWKRELPAARDQLTELWARHAELSSNLKPQVFAGLATAHAECERKLKVECRKLTGSPPPELEIDEEALMLFRRLLDDIVSAAPKGTDLSPEAPNVFATSQTYLVRARQAKSRHDEDLGQLNRQTDLSLARIKTYIDKLGRDAIGGLPFRINRARYYADTYRRMVTSLRVGSIDTWWDYSQLATRGVDPPLRFIEDVGTRLSRLRIRLRDAMEAAQTSAIANQTEATRDNTYQLEAIARGIAAVNSNLAEQQSKLIEEEKKLAKLNRRINLLYFIVSIGLLIFGLIFGFSIQIGKIRIG